MTFTSRDCHCTILPPNEMTWILYAWSTVYKCIYMNNENKSRCYSEFRCSMFGKTMFQFWRIFPDDSKRLRGEAQDWDVCMAKQSYTALVTVTMPSERYFLKLIITTIFSPMFLVLHFSFSFFLFFFLQKVLHFLGHTACHIGWKLGRSREDVSWPPAKSQQVCPQEQATNRWIRMLCNTEYDSRESEQQSIPPYYFNGK